MKRQVLEMRCDNCGKIEHAFPLPDGTVFGWGRILLGGGGDFCSSRCAGEFEARLAQPLGVEY